MSTTNTKSRKSNASSVNCITEHTTTPDMTKNEGRERLGDNKKKTEKYTVKAIVQYYERVDDTVDLLDEVDDAIAKEAVKAPNGPVKVKLLGAWQVIENETKKQRLHLKLKCENGAVVDVNLFPGEQYTDYMGVVQPAGHNWKAFAQEIKDQLNRDGVGIDPATKLTALLKGQCMKGFTTWLLFDGTYQNIYATEKKYNAACEKLARDAKKGTPTKK